MGTATEETQKNTRSLSSALDSIFLAIGNAYYEANKVTTESLAMQTNMQCNQEIRQSRSTFLDSLDQLEIIVIRATEVIEACARRRQPELFGKQTIAIGGKAGPSPESMLLNGEGLVPNATDDNVHDMPLDTILPIDNDILIGETRTAGQSNGETTLIASMGGDDMLSKADTLEQNPDGMSNMDAIVADLPQSVPQDKIDAGTTFEEDMMNLEGPIDFGDMDFENFNFDETAHFDFGTMMED